MSIELFDVPALLGSRATPPSFLIDEADGPARRAYHAHRKAVFVDVWAAGRLALAGRWPRDSS